MTTTTQSLAPPFTRDTAVAKVGPGENLWNTCDPQRVALGYTPNSWWRNRSTNENWEFDADGLMKTPHSSINDLPIAESDRLFQWDPRGPRPEDHLGLSDLGL